MMYKAVSLAGRAQSRSYYHVNGSVGLDSMHIPAQEQVGVWNKSHSSSIAKTASSTCSRCTRSSSGVKTDRQQGECYWAQCDSPGLWHPGMKAFLFGHIPLALGSEQTWGIWIWGLKVKMAI